ncbi:MAG: hypothetical protein B1H11_12095, partial [Desulfobacteraceae bacterium 4484_190.1]
MDNHRGLPLPRRKGNAPVPALPKKGDYNMYILGLQGSPRKKGNSSILLSSFLSEAEKLGAHTQYIDVTRKNIVPCQECGICEKKGYCPLDDDMQEIYPLFRRTDIII